MDKRLIRGEIYLVDLNPVRGSEQGKTRPCLIVQNNLGNQFAPTTIILPITSKIPSKKYPTDVLIPKKRGGLKYDSIALANQIRTIDKKRLIRRIGLVSKEILLQVNFALKVSLAIDPEFNFE